jgi:hypothetical protein
MLSISLAIALINFYIIAIYLQISLYFYRLCALPGDWRLGNGCRALRPGTLGSYISRNHLWSAQALAPGLRFSGTGNRFQIVSADAASPSLAGSAGAKWAKWRRWTPLAVFAATCMIVLAVSLCLSVQGTLAPLSYFANRPFQVESAATSVLWLFHRMGYSLSLVYVYGSFSVVSPLASQVSLSI